MPVSPEDRRNFLPADASTDASGEPARTFRQTAKHLLHAPFDSMAEKLAQRGTHPISITASRYPLTALGIGLHQVQPVAGLIVFVVSAIADILDGKVARISGKATQEGAVLDALTDKIVNFALYAYIFSLMNVNRTPMESVVFDLMVLNASLDVLSQRMRGPLFQQMAMAFSVIFDPEKAQPSEEKTSLMANDEGKIKAHLQFYGVMAALLAEHVQVFYFAAATSFAVGAVFAGRSIAGRLRKS